MFSDVEGSVWPYAPVWIILDVIYGIVRSISCSISSVFIQWCRLWVLAGVLAVMNAYSPYFTSLFIYTMINGLTTPLSITSLFIINKISFILYLYLLTSISYSYGQIHSSYPLHNLNQSLIL